MNDEKWKHVHNSGGGAVYGMGFIGALIYTLQHTNSFTDFLWGLFQSIFWPAFLVYKAFEMLGY